MTVLAQTGIFSYGMQTAKGTLATTWYRHRAADIDFGPVQDIRTLPLEVGGVIVPTGVYKAGAFVAGGASMYPRMEGDFGWLFKGLMGAASSVSSWGGESGVYAHAFTMVTSDNASLPWLSVRKYVPGSSAANSLGEIGQDCRVASMNVVFPQAGLVQARADFVGRVPTFAENPSWTYSDSFEDYNSIPLSCDVDASLQLPEFSGGTEIPVTALGAQFVNNITSPADEMIIGSQHPDDFVAVTRSLVLNATLKWADPDLYQRIYTNSSTGTAYSQIVYTTDFKAVATSAGNITSQAQKWSLEINAGKVAWQTDGPIRLAGGQMLTLNLRGQVIDPDSGEDYAKFVLVNAQSAYS